MPDPSVLEQSLQQSESESEPKPIKKSYKRNLGGTFTGPRETLVAILNPHVANWLQSKTSRVKKNLRNHHKLKCYNPACKTKPEEIKSFDTAHPLDKTRPDAIRQAIDEVCPIKKDDMENQLRDCDIAAVLAKAKEIHLLMQITFLCNACNKNHSNLSSKEIISKPIAEWIIKEEKQRNSRRERTLAKTS